jgi:RimJ/RimL family protein N-acetyltransferase
LSKYKNSLNQPIGFPLESWQAVKHPKGLSMSGRLCRIEPVSRDQHSEELYKAYALDVENKNWTYLPYGPFATLEQFQSWIGNSCLDDDPCFFAVIDHATGQAVGLASYLRIEPAVGVIEVGHIHFSPLMQGSAISTEAMYLMMKLVFDELGYRRYEWKCDALNAPSCASAKRLGFEFEGIFRQATIYKQRNRDTAWYSILDREWPVIKAIFETWLNRDNFDADGQQKTSLSGAMLKALDR